MEKIICILCGAFNPPHNTHFALAEQILNENLNIEKVIFVPVSTKYNKKGLIADEHRYNMLKIVCEKNDKFDVSNIEMNLEKQPYTIETLKKFREIYNEKNIVLAIGTDNLKELETWYKAEELLKNFKVLVLARDEDDVQNLIEKNEFLKANENSFTIVKSEIRTNLSSTFIRKQIKQNSSVKYLMPDEVFNYIEKNNLYKEN